MNDAVALDFEAGCLAPAQSLALIPFQSSHPITIQQIFRLEEEILKLPQVELPIQHHFSCGMYAREMRIPKGTVLTGAIHKTQHMCVLAHGDISVMVEGGVKRIKAPCLLISEPGIKRAGYAHEDSTWITFHATDETNIEALERELVHNDMAALMEQRQMEAICHSE